MDAVIFDLDGTLVLSARLHFIAYKKALGAAFTVSYAQFKQQFYGRGARFIVATCLKKKENDPAVARQAVKKQQIFSKLLKTHPLRTVAGVRPFLKKLSALNIPLALASAAQRKSIEGMLAKTKLKEYFSIVVSGEEVKRTKPAPDIFITTAKKLRVSTKKCLVFEDSSEGVSSAKKAGMLCIALLTTRTKKELMLAGADKVIRSYAALSKS